MAAPFLLLAALFSTSGSPQSELEKAIAERDRLIASNQYLDARPFAQKAVELTRKEKGESLDLSNALMAFARICFVLSDLDSCEAASKEALAICEKLVPDSLNVASIKNSLGTLAEVRADYAAAQMWHEAALAIRERLAPGSLEVAVSLNNLGVAAYNQGNIQEAKRRYEAAIAIREKLAPDSLVLASTLNNLAAVYWNLGDLDAAQKAFERALTIRIEKAPGSIAEAFSRQGMGLVAESRGNLDSAQQWYLGALALFEATAPGSLQVAGTLNNLGLLAVRRGSLDEAQRRYEAALAIGQKIAPNGRNTGDSLDKLGGIALRRGNLAEAQRMQEAALAIFEKIAPGSLDVASVVSNLGAISFMAGDMEVAKRHHEAALEIQQKVAPGGLDVAGSLNSLGLVAWQKGEFDEARSKYQAALVIQSKLAPDSLDVANTKNNLGILAVEEGDFKAALEWHRQALEIRMNRAPQSLDAVSSLSSLISLAKNGDDNDGVQDLSIRRLELLSQLVAREGLASANDLGNLGMMAQAALKSLGFLEAPAELYAWLPSLRAAGLTLLTRARLSELASNEDSEVRTAVGAAQVAAKREADWASASRPLEMDVKAWNDRLLELRAERQSADLNLATLLKSRDPRLGQGALKLETQAIQAAIPEGQALIEYLRVATWDAKTNRAGPDHYGAFVVNSSTVTFHRLGAADAIDSLVEAWQEEIAIANAAGMNESMIAASEKSLAQTARQLHGKLIAPLGALPENLLITPDSKLHSLAFGALVDASGKYLIESKLVSLVGSGRDLVEAPLVAKAGQSVIISGPDFDATKDSMAVGPSPKIVAFRSSSAKGAWDALPNATIEGDFVSQRIGGSLISGAKATEEQLLSVARPRVLHIATHGFFFPPTLTFKVGPEMIGQGIRNADSPMLRSGLVLAGANHDAELRELGHSDGWATALEISQMDLRGTELVVLSACESGRGDIHGAEGVFGLQRAFRLAGAQSLVMSLFQVPDAATQTLMRGFYGEWAPGMKDGAKLRALRSAQLQMIRNKATRHPKFWAGFVLLGGR